MTASPFAPETARELLKDWAVMNQHYTSEWTARWQVVQRVLGEQAPLAASAGERPLIVDIGCGPGQLTAQLADAFPHASVCGVDVDATVIHIARAAFTDHPHLTWHHGTVSTLLGTTRAAAVVSSALIHYLAVELLPAHLVELHDVLVPGGLFVHAERFAPPPSPLAPGQVDPWESWWDAANAAGLAGPVTVGAAPGATPLTADAYLLAAREAGFEQVGSFAVGDDVVLTGRRRADG